MHSLTLANVLAASGTDINNLKIQRHRGQVALAFGRSDAYASLGYVGLDAVAARLATVLTQTMQQRTLASRIVRDQWGVWCRVVAMAEAAPPAVPCLFYVIEVEHPNGRKGHVSVASCLDSRDEGNLRAIAADLRERTGAVARTFVAVEMHTILDDVRRNAERAGFDLSGAFLPPFGDARLDEVLQPYDDAMPDRAVVVFDGRENVPLRAAGVAAREAMERLH